MIKPASEYIWMNGEFIKWEEANCHILTHSLNYSGAAFEGERAYNGKIFKLKEHTERLFYSAASLRMKVPYSVEDIIQASEELLTINNLKNCYIRPLIWRGGNHSVKMYHPNLDVNVAITAMPSSPEGKNNITLSVSHLCKFSPNSIDVQAKTSSHYANAIISKSIAIDNGFDESILLDSMGYIAEASVANIFFYKLQDNQYIVDTPIADQFLNGITRQTVIELLRKLQITINETRIKLDDIATYHGAFITGTSVEVSGIESITLPSNEKILFQDKKLVFLLQDQYSKLVGKI